MHVCPDDTDGTPCSQTYDKRHLFTAVVRLMARVAINGLGRIGRAMLKIVVDTPGLDLVAANDIAPPDSVAYLLKCDSRWRPGEGHELVRQRVGLLESGSPGGPAYRRTDGMTQEQANDHCEARL
jgi:hypothetical protein